jgi:hypothetical protein
MFTHRNLVHRFGGIDALNYLPYLRGSFVNRFSVGQSQAHLTIPRLVVGTSQHQVPHAGQAHERFRFGPERYAQTRHLGQAAADERDTGI